METKLNIAEILRDKPQGTKLYSLTYGDCSYQEYTGDFGIECQSPNGVQFNLDEYGRYYIDGECILFPSKSMRDWSKFTWKKGDVLVSKGRRTLHVIFEGFNDDTYTTFKGKHYLCDYVNKEDYDDEEYYNDYHKEVEERTIEFEKDNLNNSQTYINIIEKKLDGKLNRDTLEIEKQPEFKDGDIITFKDRIIIIYNTYIEKSPKRTEIYYHACLKEGELTVNEYLMSCGFGEGWYSSTEEEKHNLFEALAKKGKAWDSDKKAIVDLKPKVELKPFDKVVVRCGKSDKWSIDFFSHKVSNGYICAGDSWFGYCLPYTDETAHLLGTDDDWKGGEG